MTVYRPFPYGTTAELVPNRFVQRPAVLWVTKSEVLMKIVKCYGRGVSEIPILMVLKIWVGHVKYKNDKIKEKLYSVGGFSEKSKFE